MRKIILASKSPRRQELMACVCGQFDIVTADVCEDAPDEINSECMAEYLAQLKAEAVAADNSDAVVIGCDTVVVIDDKILGKPKDREHAYKMLRELSGRRHKVYTGCCLCCEDKRHSFSEETQVEFYELSDKEIYDYIDTNDPFDKAGGYGIQTDGKLFVKAIYGDYYNVVGLPVARLKRELLAFLRRI